jgi:catechol 2,3-dioxygenase-like lactoylglutathione lyase family enzyme
MAEAGIETLRSIDIGVTNITSCLSFFTEVWGLRQVVEADGVHYLRGTAGYHHIVSLRQAARPCLVRIVFGARDRQAVDAVRARALSAGVKATGARDLSWPGGGYGFGLQDGEGRNYAVVCEAADHAAIPDQPDTPRKLSHVNLNSGAHQASAELLESLGFQVSDVTRKMKFMRCNSDHHSIVMGFAGGPTLNHIAFEMPDLESLMLGIGRMRDHGYPVEWGPGRHGPGNNAFAYFAGPEEMPLEYTCEMQQVDDTHVARSPQDWTWPPGRIDHWGLTAGPTARMVRVQHLIGFAADGYQLQPTGSP